MSLSVNFLNRESCNRDVCSQIFSCHLIIVHFVRQHLKLNYCYSLIYEIYSNLVKNYINGTHQLSFLFSFCWILLFHLQKPGCFIIGLHSTTRSSTTLYLYLPFSHKDIYCVANIFYPTIHHNICKLGVQWGHVTKCRHVVILHFYQDACWLNRRSMYERV